MDQLLNFVEPHFAQWGYLIVFCVTLLENATFVGALVPGDVVLLAAGFYAESGTLQLGTVVALAFAGGVVGDVIGYAVGRTGGRPVIDRFGRRLLLPKERMARVERYFARHGTMAIFLGRFAPMVRTVRTFVAGMSRMPFWSFLLVDVLAAAVWAVAVPLLGFAFAGSLHLVRAALGTGGLVVLGALVVLFVLTYRRMVRRMQREQPDGTTVNGP